MKPNAWVARVELKTLETISGKPNYMLGGVKVHVSSPFAERIDAVSFAEQSIQVNRMRPGHSLDIMVYDVFQVYSKNPIPATNQAYERKNNG